MPLDPSIILGYKQPEIENPLNAVGKLMALKNAQQEGELGSLKLDEQRRNVSDTASLNDAYKAALSPDGTVNRTSLYSNLASRGLGAKLPAIQKGYADQDKSAMEAEKLKLETGITKANLGAQILSSAKDQASYDAARAEAQARGLDISRMPPQYDPAFVAGKLQETLSFKDQLEQKWKEKEYTTPKADAVLSSNTAIENNKRTVGASMANASATREVASATRDAAQINSNQNTEMKLGDDYRAQSKNYKETADAYKQISAVLDKATTSPAATLAGATKFMKMIDPGSVVRESELGMALAATGAFDRIGNYMTTLQKGKVLTANQVADFKATTKQINDAASSQQKLIDKHFTDVAKGYKLRPEMVVQDFGQNSTEPVDLSAVPNGKGGPKVVNFGDLK